MSGPFARSIRLSLLIRLKESALALDAISSEDFDKKVRPERECHFIACSRR